MNAPIRQRFEQINVWQKGDQRAPHKPLLILLALARIQRGESRFVKFSEIEDPLRSLLREFGPKRQSYHPEYPFGRLRNDGLWEFDASYALTLRESNTDPTLTSLRELGVSGGFTEDVQNALTVDPSLTEDIATLILQGHFAESLHEDILRAVGLNLSRASSTESKQGIRPRDPAFRERILTVYERRCCVCGWDVRVGESLVALEAAHIKWHQAGGPAVESNGLALCSIHHKLFDRGAFTVADDHHIIVSEETHGGEAFETWLLRYHRTPLREPIRTEYQAASAFLDWHGREVFRGRRR